MICACRWWRPCIVQSTLACVSEAKYACMHLFTSSSMHMIVCRSFARTAEPRWCSETYICIASAHFTVTVNNYNNNTEEIIILTCFGPIGVTTRDPYEAWTKSRVETCHEGANMHWGTKSGTRCLIKLTLHLAWGHGTLLSGEATAWEEGNKGSVPSNCFHIHVHDNVTFAATPPVKPLYIK